MKNSAIVTALNVLTLVIGIAIGTAVRPSFSAHAQVREPKVEEIQPVMTAGSAAFVVVLGHQVEADALVVNGYDVMKMQNGILNYLSSRPLAERADIQKIVDESRPDTFYKVKSPPKPEVQPSEKKEQPK